jgi:hypothetical protein
MALCPPLTLRTHHNPNPSCAPLKAANDYRFDARLFATCDAAVREHCANVDPGDGRELDCLVGLRDLSGAREGF